MYYFLLPLILACTLYADQPNLMISIPIAGSEGLVDKFSSDVIPDNASPDLQNVYVDKDAGIVSRNGYSKYTSFNLGAFPVKQLYEYIQSNGTRYMIAVCSRTAYWITDTSSGVIKSGLSDYYHWFTTWQDKLYSGNLSDTVWNWDGVNVGVSSSLPKCEYATTWGNRLLIAREIDSGSILYETLNNSDVIDDITSDGYEFVSPDDGDTITGIRLYQGQVIIWKRYSTWKIVGTYFGNSQVYNISKEVGCLDSGSIQEHRGALKWLSHKGIVQYNGDSIGVISTPIDNAVNGLSQKSTIKYAYQQTFPSDFGSGSGSNIDTTTVLGSIVMPYVTGVNQQNIDSTPVTTGSSSLDFYSDPTIGCVCQTFVPSKTGVLSSVSFLVSKANSPTGNIQLFIRQYSNDALQGGTLCGILPMASVSSGDPTWITCNASVTGANVTLNSGTTYYIFISSNSNASYNYQSDISSYTRFYRNALYTIGKARYSLVSWGDSGVDKDYTATSSYTWVDKNPAQDLYFKVSIVNGGLPTRSVYTSKLGTVNNWNNWGIVSFDQNLGSYATSQYLVNTGWSGITQNTIATDGLLLNSTTAPYIMWSATITLIIPNATNNTDLFDWQPRINAFLVNYNTDQSASSVIYDDRYWLSVSTIGDNSNSTIIVQDQRDKWVRFSGINATSLRVFNQKLYSGSSDNLGQVYLQDSGWTDDGSAIDAYYTTKSYNLGEPYKRKIFNGLWTTVKTTSGTVGIDYKLDSSTVAWKGLDGSPTATRINMNDSSWGNLFVRNSFRFLPQGRYIQFRIRNSNVGEYFTFKNLSLMYGLRELEY